MNAKTHIANAIDIAKDKSSYNEHAINILSDLHILAHIMQGTLHECKDMSIPDIISTIEGTPEVKSIPVHSGETISGDKNKDVVPNEGTTLFDIRYHAHIPNMVQSVKILITINYTFLYNVSGSSYGVLVGLLLLSLQDAIGTLFPVFLSIK